VLHPFFSLRAGELGRSPAARLEEEERAEDTRGWKRSAALLATDLRAV